MAFDGTDSTIHAVIYIVLSIFNYGSKVGAHYWSTLFADLSMGITYRENYRKWIFFGIRAHFLTLGHIVYSDKFT